MDKLIQYRQLIQQILKQYAAGRIHRTEGELEDELILDTERDRYLLMAVGWEKSRRVYFPIFHLDIKDSKIWVQEDATDYDIVSVLEENGVPKHDIVLAFHAPYKRQYTGYAVA